jgi:hypothetical protein
MAFAGDEGVCNSGIQKGGSSGWSSLIDLSFSFD